VSKLLQFTLDLYERTALCAQDKPTEAVIKWLHKVEEDKIKVEDLRKPGAGFVSLDRKLSVALKSILPPDLEKHVQTEAARMVQDGKMMSGRQVLWHIYNFLRTSPNQTKIIGFVDVAKIKYFGDHNKHGFLNHWNNRMLMTAGNIDYWMKAEVLEDALKDSEDMKVEMMAYRKKYPQTLGETKGEERYKAIMDILTRTVIQERDARNRLERERQDARYLEKQYKGQATAPAQPKGNGKHDGKGKGSPKPSKGGKGAGKGKDRSQSAKGNRKGSGGKGKSDNKTGNLCVYWVVSGACQRGDQCSYRHERPKDDDEDKRYRDMYKDIKARSQSPGPKGKGKGSGICQSWKSTGSCKYGDSCKYKHDDVPAAPASSKGGRRQRSRGRSSDAKPKANPAAPAAGAPTGATSPTS